MLSPKAKSVVKQLVDSCQVVARLLSGIQEAVVRQSVVRQSSGNEVARQLGKISSNTALCSCIDEDKKISLSGECKVPDQSHCIEVAQGDIFMEKKMRFGLVWGWFGAGWQYVLKKKIGADYEQLLRTVFFMFSWPKNFLKIL